MTRPKHYLTAKAFSQALDEQLRSLANVQAGYDITRIRRQVVFDRLLARLFQPNPALWILKGGYAMELRADQARTTRDIDLSLSDGRFLLKGDDDILGIAIQRELQRQAANDLGDFFQFLISEPILDLEVAPYGGARFHVEARLDERTFSKFHLDIGVGDEVVRPLDLLESRDWLGFAGITPTKYPTLSKEQHFAEKIHAYTLPRAENRPNSRVKDLIDLVLLIETEELDCSRLQQALDATFRRRGTHSFSKEFPNPPADWEKPFQRLAEEVNVDPDLSRTVVLVRTFLEQLM